MDGSLFCFASEMVDCGLSRPLAIALSRYEKMPTSRLGEEAGTHRVDGGVRSAVASRLTTLPIDATIVLHDEVLGLSCRTLSLCRRARRRCATLLHC